MGFSRTGKTRIAFVAPRDGDAVVGGSEAVMREAAEGLAGRGYNVEVLTTCAQDHFTWANELPPGVATDGSVTVRRFPTVQNRDYVGWNRVQDRLLSGTSWTNLDELAWINGRFRVPDLYLYLSGHAEEYAAIVFSPYLFWTTLYCASIAPERTVLMPCLHDEPYAYLSICGRCTGVGHSRLVPLRARAPARPSARAGGRSPFGVGVAGRDTRVLRPGWLSPEA